MNALLKWLAGIGLLMALATSAQAAERGTADEATAMVKKAIAAYQAQGDKAYADFNRADGGFRDRDLYVFVHDKNGLMFAHGANAKLIGKNVIDLQDVEGKPLIRAFIDVAFTKGSGWVDYKWPNPVTKSVEQKRTYVERVGDLVFGCGIYK